jgi:catechol 2,3-dioxygenase
MDEAAAGSTAGGVRTDMAHASRPHLSHLGIFVRDLALMERFYTTVFGLLVTDRGVGKVFRNDLVFLSGTPDQHHQLVLSTGRGSDAPSTIMQLSFKVDTIEELRALRAGSVAFGVGDMIELNHGNAWSVYFNDPEGNRIEIYMDTPFHTPQPCGEPLDLSKSIEALTAETAELIAGLPGSMPRNDYVTELAGRLC